MSFLLALLVALTVGVFGGHYHVQHPHHRHHHHAHHRHHRKAHRSSQYTPWASAEVSMYGGTDGFFYHTMANGEPYEPDSLGVASRTLAFGTKVQFCYHGCVVATVMDRGPYVYSRLFDLQVATSQAIGFPGLGVVRYRLQEARS